MLGRRRIHTLLRWTLLLGWGSLGSAYLGSARAAAQLDLTEATVVADTELTPLEKTALKMLLDEVAARSGGDWTQSVRWPADRAPTVVVGSRRHLPAVAGRFAAQLGEVPAELPAEGYHIQVLSDEQGSAVFVLGNDPRGTLYGVGRLLRALNLYPDRVTLAADFELTSAPAYSLRGHQLGYRPKTNSYDAWDLPVWEQYYRDLVVFGANAVELVPPRTDDDATSPHFPRPQLEMIEGMSALADRYGLDVWIWFPALDADYEDDRTMRASLKEWGQVFQALPRIDAVFVPGGDPGHTHPRVLLDLLAKQTENLHRYHPQAQMWVSPQSFNETWMAEFLGILRDQSPEWLSGVVFGPQVRLSLPKLREAVPERYPIRHYPDITHSRQCQYPVPDWDVAHAVTSARECINPRPLGEATIFRLLEPYTVGFLTYSEGCNDDVNKAVWSALGWQPDQDVETILREYAGYFIGADYREGFAQGLLALERNWRGPLLTNWNVETTLEQFQSLERQADSQTRGNWRFQQALYRAYYDAYVRARLLNETALEMRALERLDRARPGITRAALDEAEAILDSADAAPVATRLRERLDELAEDLFQSIKMQTSVKRYQAIDVDRGATLDTADFPLNNRYWLKQRLAQLRQTDDEAARVRGIREIVEWTNPGPGGFYDDLGNPARQPHLVVGPGFDHDPAFLVSAHGGFAGPETIEQAQTQPWRMAWMDHAEAMLEAPLVVRYTGLDPDGRYRLRIVYAGDGPQKKIRLATVDGIEIHPMQAKPMPIRPLEFEVPLEATRSGTLELHWTRESGLGDNGRGCQVSELWLLRGEPVEAAEVNSGGKAGQ